MDKASLRQKLDAESEGEILQGAPAAATLQCSLLNIDSEEYRIAVNLACRSKALRTAQYSRRSCEVVEPAVRSAALKCTRCPLRLVAPTHTYAYVFHCQ